MNGTWAWVVAVGATAALAGCGGNDSPMEPDPPDPDPPTATYAERIAAGWASFEAGSYASARSAFAAAVSQDPAPIDAYVGLGWSELKRDALDAAHDAFASGADNAGTDALRTDLFAGWAFAWSARQSEPNRHAESNARIADAEALESDWVFDHLPDLDASDLTLLAAENHFALGEFAASLARVQTLDASFTADVGTAEGQASLAARIEELRAGS